MTLYLIGSLRNSKIPQVASRLRNVHGVTVFDDWFAAGKCADDAWRDYELGRQHTYAQALKGHAARHVFTLDNYHLNRAHAGVLTLPAGKSGHLEAGILAGQGKPVWLLLDKGVTPARLDVMTQFLTGVCASVEEVEVAISTFPWPKLPHTPELHVSDALWLAGLLEGEGSFCVTKAGKQKPTPRLVLQMTDYDIVARAASLLDVAVWNRGRKTKSGKDVWGCGVAGLSAIEWMRIMRPMLGVRRQQQILKTVQEWLDTRTRRSQDRKIWLRWFQIEVGGYR